MRLSFRDGSLAAVLAGVITTTNPTFCVTYSDETGSHTILGTLDGTTAVNLLAATTPRALESAAILNADSEPAQVSIRLTIGGVTKTLFSPVLQVGDSLIIDAAGGFRVVDANGRVKTAPGSSVATVVSQEIPLERGIIWDAATVTALGATPASADDFGYTKGTHGTSNPTLRTADGKSATKAHKVRFPYVVPNNYVAGSALTLRMNGGMVTTVSDTTATLDAVVTRRAAPTVDICATAAQSVNSLTPADVDFTLTPDNVVPGDVLDIVVTADTVDGAGATAVILQLNSVKVRATCLIAT